MNNPQNKNMAITPEQAYWARTQFSRWLAIKEQHERTSFQSGSPRRWKDGELTRHRADVDHSGLLYYLLRGGEPLDEPPELSHAYPVYPDHPDNDL